MDTVSIIVIEGQDLIGISPAPMDPQLDVIVSAVPELISITYSPQIEQVIVDTKENIEIVNVVITEARNGTDGYTPRKGVDYFDGQDVSPDTVQRFELLISGKLHLSTYTEFVITGGEITQINYWSDATKSNKLFTKNITYVLGNPTLIVLTDNLTGLALTTSITYVAGDVTSITKTWN